MLSDKGLEFIASFEGYHTEQPDGSCKAYQCQAGVWTCGYGATEGVTPETHWTRSEALERFRGELEKHEDAVSKAVKVAVSQDQFDALCSFSYNCGTGALDRVAAVLNANGPKAASAKLLEYTKFRNPKTKQMEVSRGLVRRRAAEARLLEPDDPLGTMPQKVAPPPVKMSVKEAAAKVGTVAAGVGAAASQAKDLIPPVPQAAKDALAHAKELQSVGGEIAVIGKSAWSAAAAYPILAVLICACVAAWWWLRRAQPQ